MATVIDALLVTLGLDAKGLKKGAKEVDETLAKTGKKAKKPAGELEDVGKKGAVQMDKFRNSVLRTTAALVGMSVIKSFVADVTKGDIALGRMAANANMTVGGMSAMKLAADAAGSSGDSFAASMQGIAETLTKFGMTGEGGDSLKWFRALKIRVDDGKGGMRDMKDIALDAADALSKLSAPQALVAGKGLGFSDTDIALLRQGRVAVKAYYDEAAKANTRTPEDVKAAHERQKAWALMLATFNRLATDVLNKVTPALVGLANFIRAHAGPIATLIAGVSVALTTMSAIRFVGLISQLGQLAGALRGVSAAATMASVAGAGGSGVAARAALGSRGGVAGASLFAGYELWNLGDALKQLWDIKHREGVKLSASAQARADSGELSRSSAGGAGDKGAYLASLEKQFGLPPGLLDAVWFQESRRGKKMLSPKGAKGHFGFMDKTASSYGVLDPNDFGQSAMGAARMYRDLLAQYKGNLPMALAAYNWGSGNLAAGGLGRAPLETRGYIGSIMSNMRGGGAAMASNSSTNDTHVGSMTVVLPNARDGDGMVRDLRSKLHPRQLAMQANMGLS